MGNSFEIIGGTELRGEIVPQGAKNEALQILCATLMTPEKVLIRNIPDIRDVNKLIELLQHLGVHVEQTGAARRHAAVTVESHQERSPSPTSLIHAS